MWGSWGRLGRYLAGMLVCAGTVAAQASDTRQYFRDWLAACRQDGTGYCSASAYVRSRRDGGLGYDFQLRIARPGADAPYEVIFSPVYDRLAEKAPLTLQVDEQEAITVQSTAYRLAAGPTDYQLTDEALTARLVPDLKRGRSVRFSYRNERGKPEVAEFSLMGLTAALEFMDRVVRTTGPSSDSGPLPATFTCYGNEPFWRLTLESTEAGFTTPLLTQRLEPLRHAGSSVALDYLRPRLYAWRGRSPGAEQDLVAFVSEERCIDTMASPEEAPEYLYRARVSMPGGQVLVGCCHAGLERPGRGQAVSAASLSAKGPDDWSSELLSLKPAIDACLAQTPGEGRRVSKGWPMKRGMVGVRTGNDTGARFSCVVDAEGSAVTFFQRLGKDEPRVPGEGSPVFSPAAGGPPTGECYEHERVVDPAGELLGWLSYDTC